MRRVIPRVIPALAAAAAVFATVGLLGPPAQAAAPRAVDVSTSAQLRSALAAAVPGQTIRLAAGSTAARSRPGDRGPRPGASR